MTRSTVAAVVCAWLAAAPPSSHATDQDLPKSPSETTRRGWNDQRRTMRSYGTNLLRNSVGVLSGDHLRPLLVTAALTAPALALDDEVVRLFREHPRRRFGQLGQDAGGALAASGVGLGLFAAGRVARGDRFRAATYDVSQAIIVTQLYTQGLKFAVGRERPDGSNRKSFPSGHASNAFAVAGALGHHYGPWVELPAYALAAFVATSRCAANKHYLSDVVAGAGLGWGMGRAVARRNSSPPSSGSTTEGISVTLLPDAGPARDGRGVALRIAF